MPFILSAAYYSTRRLYWTSPRQVPPDQAARERARRLHLDGCNSWLPCSAPLNSSHLNDLMASTALFNEGTVCQPHMSEHQFVLFHHSNSHLCPVGSINDSESNSIFSDIQVQSSGLRVSCENENLAVQLLLFK
jgi:hypothetical protein